MRSLLSVELRRLLSRRIVAFVAAMAMFGMVLAGLVLFIRSHRPDPSTAAQLRAQAETFYQRSVASCAAGGYGISQQDLPPGLTLEQYCRKIVAPPTIPDGYHLARYRDVAEGLSGIFIAILLVLGATSAGAEWHAGTVTTQLTWEPRRGPLLLAKVVAAAPEHATGRGCLVAGAAGAARHHLVAHRPLPLGSREPPLRYSAGPFRLTSRRGRREQYIDPAATVSGRGR